LQGIEHKTVCEVFNPGGSTLKRVKYEEILLDNAMYIAFFMRFWD